MADGDREIKSIELTVDSCKNLKGFNFLKKIVAHAVVWIGDRKKRQKTPRDRENNRNPEWKHKIWLDMESLRSSASSSGTNLEFEIRVDGVLGDKTIGKVHVPIKRLVDDYKGSDTHASYQIRGSNDEQTGMLNFYYRIEYHKVDGGSSHAQNLEFNQSATPCDQSPAQPVSDLPMMPSSMSNTLQWPPGMDANHQLPPPIGSIPQFEANPAPPFLMSQIPIVTQPPGLCPPDHQPTFSMSNPPIVAQPPGFRPLPTVTGPPEFRPLPPFSMFDLPSVSRPPEFGPPPFLMYDLPIVSRPSEFHPPPFSIPDLPTISPPPRFRPPPPLPMSDLPTVTGPPEFHPSPSFLMSDFSTVSQPPEFYPPPSFPMSDLPPVSRPPEFRPPPFLMTDFSTVSPPPESRPPYTNQQPSFSVSHLPTISRPPSPSFPMSDLPTAIRPPEFHPPPLSTSEFSNVTRPPQLRPPPPFPMSDIPTVTPPLDFCPPFSMSDLPTVTGPPGFSSPYANHQRPFPMSDLPIVAQPPEFYGPYTHQQPPSPFSDLPGVARPHEFCYPSHETHYQEPSAPPLDQQPCFSRPALADLLPESYNQNF